MLRKYLLWIRILNLGHLLSQECIQLQTEIVKSILSSLPLIPPSLKSQVRRQISYIYNQNQAMTMMMGLFCFTESISNWLTSQILIHSLSLGLELFKHKPYTYKYLYIHLLANIPFRSENCLPRGFLRIIQTNKYITTNVPSLSCSLHRVRVFNIVYTENPAKSQNFLCEDIPNKHRHSH